MTTTLPPPALRTSEPFASPYAIEVIGEEWAATPVQYCFQCDQPCGTWECVGCATAADADYARALDR